MTGEQKDLLRKMAKQHRDVCVNRRQLAKIRTESKLFGLAEHSTQAANESENVSDAIEAALKEVEALVEIRKWATNGPFRSSLGPQHGMGWNEAMHSIIALLPPETPNEPNEAT